MACGRRPRRRAAGTTCFVAGGSTVRRELLLHGGHRALAGVDAGRVPEKDPRLSFLDRVQHVVQNGRELQERRRRGPAVKHRDVGHLHDVLVQPCHVSG